jgi:uncharacterized protein
VRLRRSQNGKGAGESAYRIFFATDIHGSDRCFRKFLAAAKVYHANALVLGGDIAGKAIVPIVQEDADEFRIVFQGADRVISAEELPDVRAQIEFTGLYPYECDREEHDRVREDLPYREELFARVISQQVAGWCNLAAERLSPEVRCVITPGNDDPVAIDATLASAARIESPERQVLELGPAWLASLGNTNRTPWDTEREFDEPEIRAQIDEMLAGSTDERPLVFNFHCPPYDSGLDTATKLDADFRPVAQNGVPIEIPVGSTAVRDAIAAYRPVVGLHGHIHEARGVQRLADTYCFNPGSDYSSGVLNGLIVDLAPNGQYVNHLLTTG